MLLHASHRWPKAINIHLWPYALRLAAHIRNHVPRESEGGIPIQVFSGTQAHNKVFTNGTKLFKRSLVESLCKSISQLIFSAYISEMQATIWVGLCVVNVGPEVMVLI